MAKPSSKGVDGEIRVALEIATLDRAEYHAVHNVTVMVDDGTTQIDHVVISKYGIFVVETKNYTGWIFGREQESKWSRSANGRTDKFQNPIRQNVRHIKSLSELLGVEEYLFHSVIAFCGDSEFKTPMPPSVLASGYADYIRSKRIFLFTESEASLLAEKLKSLMLERGEETDRKHLESLRQRHASKETSKATISEMAIQGAKRNNSATRRPRFSAEARVQNVVRPKPGLPVRKQRRLIDQPIKGLAAGILLMMVLIFAANRFNSGMGSMDADIQRHQNTENKDLAERGLDSASREIQSSRSITSLARAREEAPVVPRNSVKDKQEAWGRWYSPPPECEILTELNMVECGNKHIRAKQNFEHLYAQGKLR